MTDRELLELLLEKVSFIEEQMIENKKEQERYKKKAIATRQRAKIQMENQMNNLPPAFKQMMQNVIPQEIYDEDGE